jgi:branched-chain amino acid transport system substrate-binding protein
VAFGLLIVGSLVVFAACGDDDNSGASSTSELKIGALLSLTGDWSTLGKASQAALELAAESVNAQPASAGLPKVTIIVKDTQLKPANALDQLKALVSEGVKVVVGPQSSSEVAAVKEYAQQNGVIIISQGSTSSTLSLSGDTIYRLAPDDRQETAAMAALLKADGITAIIPAWRADIGNQGLQTSIRTAFQAAGGKATAGIEYAATTPDFAKVLDAVEQQLAAARSTAGAKVAIYLAAFDEVTQLFAAAATRPALAGVAWYGSDGVALSSALTGDAAAAAFASKAGYPNPIFGLDHSDAGKAKWQPIFDKVKAKANQDPDAFALSAYDAVLLAAKAVKAAGGISDAAKLGKALADQAAATSGITGSLALNDAGDRAHAAFDFFVVCTGGGTPTWALVASYVPAASGQGTITKLKGCG